MKALLLVTLASLALAQKNVEDAINTIFDTNVTETDDFWKNYEEVTQPPLKGYGALTKCGEGDQKDKFVCVPYYNCDASTNTVRANAEVDGSDKINIRFGDDEMKCDHYMEVCCQLPNNETSGTTGSIQTDGTNGTGGTGGVDTATGTGTTAGTGGTSGTGTTTGTGGTDATTGSGTRTNGTTAQRRHFCGIRNTKGIDFTFNARNGETLFGEFPWMVAILKKNPKRGETLSVCGGSLIHPRVILTGAHCVNSVNINEIKVRVGEWDTQTTKERIPHQERDVVQKIVHKDYFASNLYNDMALLILDRPLAKTDSIGTICLPKQNQNINSKECFASGWGKTQFGQEGRYAVILKKIQLPLVQHGPCQRDLRKTRLGNQFVLHRSFICAGGEPGVDTCTGDGGSPLVCPDPSNPGRYIQAGIVAWGIGCGLDQVPGVYVDVAKYRNWVDLKLQELEINSASYN